MRAEGQGRLDQIASEALQPTFRESNQSGDATTRFILRARAALVIVGLTGCTLVAPFDPHGPRTADADADADANGDGDGDGDADADGDGDGDADADVDRNADIPQSGWTCFDVPLSEDPAVSCSSCTGTCVCDEDDALTCRTTGAVLLLDTDPEEPLTVGDDGYCGTAGMWQEVGIPAAASVILELDVEASAIWYRDELGNPTDSYASKAGLTVVEGSLDRVWLDDVTFGSSLQQDYPVSTPTMEPRSVDLTRWAGKTVRLELVVEELDVNACAEDNRWRRIEVDNVRMRW